MRRAIVTLAATASAVYLGLCLLLFFTQRSMIYLPTRWEARGNEIETLAVPEAQLAVSVLRRQGPCATIYFGGNAEAVAWTLPELDRAFPECALYAPHYRGYGRSTGEPSEEALYADALALFDRVHPEHPEVVVVGRSLGAAVATHVASRRPASRLVLVTPFDSLANVGAHHYPIFPVRWLLRDRYDAWRDAPRVTAPTRLIVAGRDEIVPRRLAQSLLAHFRPGVATLAVVPGATHNTISERSDYLPLLAGRD